MNITFKIIGICVTPVLFCQAAQAEVKLRAGLSNMDYSYEEAELTATSNIQALNLGLTIPFGESWYFDGSLSGGIADYDAVGFSSDEIARADTSLVVGKHFTYPNSEKQGNFYFGYKTGNSLITLPGGFGAIDFVASGIIGGFGLAIPIDSYFEGIPGFWGINYGIGLMEGSIFLNGWEAEKTDAIGYSIGLNYNLPINSQFGVIVDYKINKYTFEFISGDVTEMFNILSASVYYNF
jgi:hypothetical protein